MTMVPTILTMTSSDGHEDYNSGTEDYYFTNDAYAEKRLLEKIDRYLHEEIEANTFQIVWTAEGRKGVGYPFDPNLIAYGNIYYTHLSELLSWLEDEAVRVEKANRGGAIGDRVVKAKVEIEESIEVDVNIHTDA